MAHSFVLAARGVLKITGPDRVAFLQGLVSNDVAKVSETTAQWSAFLTPQGKFLHEFFMIERDDALWLECEADRLSDLKRRLSIYRLRSKVEISDVSEELAVVLLFGDGALQALGLSPEPGQAVAFGGGVAFVDPRLAELGARALLPRDGMIDVLRSAGFVEADLETYDRQRIPLGVPDGSRDLEVERSILLENGFDELHGIDWDKGCFMGQELTARTRYRALIKKRLLPVDIEGPNPGPGTVIKRNGKEAGVLRSVAGDQGLALLRLAQISDDEGQDLTAGEAHLTVRTPAWVRLQQD